jgi:hypothetical protein
MCQIILIVQTVFDNLHFTVSPVELVFDKFIDFSGGHPQVLHGLVSGDFLGESFVHGSCGRLEHVKMKSGGIVVYYETIKRELQIKPISECRCDERLKTKTEEFTLLSDTGLLGELEHLKIKTRLIDQKFVSVMGECVI